MCFRVKQASSAIEIYVFSSDFSVLFVGSVIGNPFLQMFRIIYCSVFNNFSRITQVMHVHREFGK